MNVLEEITAARHDEFIAAFLCVAAGVKFYRQVDGPRNMHLVLKQKEMEANILKYSLNVLHSYGCFPMNWIDQHLKRQKKCSQCRIDLTMFYPPQSWCCCHTGVWTLWPGQPSLAPPWTGMQWETDSPTWPDCSPSAPFEESGQSQHQDIILHVTFHI